jgi:predicted dehydrogenase
MTLRSERAVFTVLGSGFGIYGYLPALVEAGFEVALPIRYRPVIGGRPELSRYMQQVVWCSDAEDALARSSGVVIALRPEDQARWVPRLTQMPNIRQLILEKPVAPAPELAASLLAAVENAGKRYRVGYTFRFTPWAGKLRSALAGSAESISFDWNFLAHHYRADLANWKRFSSHGGGAVRFYGIHAIALCSELGYDDVSTSTISGTSDEETERWEATFTGRNLCPCVLKLDSRETNTFFRIVAHNNRQAAETLVGQPGPFSSVYSSYSGAMQGQDDARVGVLKQLCDSFSEADEGHAERQKAILALWAAIETKSRRVPLTPAGEK